MSVNGYQCEEPNEAAGAAKIKAAKKDPDNYEAGTRYGTGGMKQMPECCDSGKVGQPLKNNS